MSFWTPIHEFVIIPSQNSHPRFFIGNYELCLKFTFHYKLDNWQILLPLYHLGFVLLHTTNDNQKKILCFHMVFNNSSLFMSMSNLI
jgi:hypothetical protein